MPAEIKLNEAAQSLLDMVNKLYPQGSVFVQFDEKKSGYVRHDQAKTTTLPGGLVITVTDATAPNYTASHELLHLLMLLRGFPQIFFDLSLGKKELDEQMMMMSTDIYDICMHRVIVKEQREHGLIDDKIEQEYLAGVQATIDPEKGKQDEQGVLRLLTLLDAMVFYGNHLDQYADTMKKDYPLAYAAAEKLYADMNQRAIESPFDMRRAIVHLYRAFDDQLLDWGLPALHNNQFTTLSPVLSARQLKLSVKQVFEIYHSDMKDRNGNDDVYIGVMRSDRQNSFVMPAPAGKNRPQKFVELYDEPVEKFLEDIKMPFILRK